MATEIIDEGKIRYIENGEPHHEEVYNRPTRDLVKETDKSLVEVQQSLGSDIIAMVIALG